LANKKNCHYKFITAIPFPALPFSQHFAHLGKYSVGQINTNKSLYKTKLAQNSTSHTDILLAKLHSMSCNLYVAN